MALSIHTTQVQAMEQAGQKTAQGKSVFAGNLNLNKSESAIDKRRDLARKQAMKLIADAWEKDSKTASQISNMESQKADKVSELNEIKAKYSDIEKQKLSLQEQYGVDSDSQEQKDLDLLQKYQDYRGGSACESFSEEEIGRLKELQNIPRTEYQNRVLQTNASKSAIDLEVNKKENEIMGLSQSVTDASIEQLKSQDMLQAQNVADQIIEAAHDEIFDMLVKEGTDKIDEDMKEAQEEAEKAQEKKEEQQEQKEQNEQEDLLNKVAQSDKLQQNIANQQTTSKQVNDAQKQIQKLMTENGMINEELKGINIDFNF